MQLNQDSDACCSKALVAVLLSFLQGRFQPGNYF